MSKERDIWALGAKQGLGTGGFELRKGVRALEELEAVRGLGGNWGWRMNHRGCKEWKRVTEDRKGPDRSIEPEGSRQPQVTSESPE